MNLRDPVHSDPHRNLARLVRAYHEALCAQSADMAKHGIFQETAPYGAIIGHDAPGADSINDIYEEMLDCLEECEAWERTHR